MVLSLLLELSDIDRQTDEHTLLVEKASLEKICGCTEQEVLQDPHGKVVQGQRWVLKKECRVFSTLID